MRLMNPIVIIRSILRWRNMLIAPTLTSVSQSYRNHQVEIAFSHQHSAFRHTNPQDSGFALAPQVRARRVRCMDAPHESNRNHQVYSEALRSSPGS